MKKFKFSWILFGFFLGFLVAYNYVLDDMVYRISFYGFERKGENIYPIIKLRKRLSSETTRLFHPDDQGLPIAIIKMTEPGQSIEFTDDQIKQKMREAYCK